MSDSETNEDDLRSTNVAELQSLLTFLNVAERKTSAVAMREALAPVRELVDLIAARNRSEEDSDDDKTLDNDHIAIPMHALENKRFCETEWDDHGFDSVKNAFIVSSVGLLTGKSNWLSWWQKNCRDTTGTQKVLHVVLSVRWLQRLGVGA